MSSSTAVECAGRAAFWTAVSSSALIVAPLLGWLIMRTRRARAHSTGKLWWMLLGCLETIPESLVLAMTSVKGSRGIEVALIVMLFAVVSARSGSIGARSFFFFLPFRF